MHVNDMARLCHVVIAFNNRSPHTGLELLHDRVVQFAITQKAIIAKRNEKPFLTIYKSLFYKDFQTKPIWHAGCIISTCDDTPCKGTGK